MADQDTDWVVVDEGPPDRFGIDPSHGHYEKHFADPEAAAAEAQRLATERGHVIRVVANFWPGK